MPDISAVKNCQSGDCIYILPPFGRTKKRPWDIAGVSFGRRFPEGDGYFECSHQRFQDENPSSNDRTQFPTLPVFRLVTEHARRYVKWWHLDIGHARCCYCTFCAEVIFATLTGTQRGWDGTGSEKVERAEKKGWPNFDVAHMAVCIVM